MLASALMAFVLGMSRILSSIYTDRLPSSAAVSGRSDVRKRTESSVSVGFIKSGQPVGPAKTGYFFGFFFVTPPSSNRSFCSA